MGSLRGRRAPNRSEWKAILPLFGGYALVVALRAARLVHESEAGLLLAVGLPAIALTRFARSTSASTTRWMRAATTATAIAALAVAVAAGIEAAHPGSSLARAENIEAGQSIVLPEDAGGEVRIMVAVALSRRRDDLVSVTLSGATAPIRAEFATTTSHRTDARGGRQHVANRGAESRYFEATIPPGTRSLRIEEVTSKAPVRVEVYPPSTPWAYYLCASVVVVLVSTLVALRAQLSDLAVFSAGQSQGFALAFAAWATPSATMGPALAATIVGFAVGVAHELLLWSCRRMARARRSARKARSNSRRSHANGRRRS
jgi:hypothetical protein